LGPDGNYYCISNSQPEFSSIQANLNNAVPTPSSIVQLPPIVQPIALVPFASQNQPLLQYDPNYRPPEPSQSQSAPAPKYRLKPYKGISLIQILCSVATIVLLVLLTVIDGQRGIVDWSEYAATGLDTIYGLLAVFGISVGSSVYYDKLLSAHFTSDLGQAFSSDWLMSAMYLLIPAFVVIALLISVILVIAYLVKMGKQKSPRGFNAGALINLCLIGAVIAMVFGISQRQNMELMPGLALYIAAAINLFMIIFPYFAKKNAYVLDAMALKQTYILDNAQA
jgi:hypothetical protein